MATKRFDSFIDELVHAGMMDEDSLLTDRVSSEGFLYKTVKSSKFVQLVQQLLKGLPGKHNQLPPLAIRIEVGYFMRKYMILKAGNTEPVLDPSTAYFNIFIDEVVVQHALTCAKCTQPRDAMTGDTTHYQLTTFLDHAIHIHPSGYHHKDSDIHEAADWIMRIMASRCAQAYHMYHRSKPNAQQE